MRILVTVRAVVLCALAASAAASADPLGPLLPRQFVEKVRPSAPVGGGDILGIRVEGATREAGALPLFVRVPSTWPGGSVCLEVTSRDGFYVASGTYSVPRSATPSWVQLSFDTKQDKRYREATRDSLGITVRASDCSSDGGTYLPVSWDRPVDDAPPRVLTVAVQSGRSKARLAVGTGRGEADIVPCAPIGGSHMIAFDAICRVPLGDRPNGPVTLQLERCAYDECSRTRPVELTP